LSGQAHCKICGSGDAPVHFLLYCADVAVRRCRDCGFTFVDYRADEEHLASSGHDATGVPDAQPGAAAKWERRLKIYAQTGGLNGKRLLDVGAGGGSWLAAARAAGAEVFGTEFCETCREFARSQFELELDAHALDDGYWQCRAGTFDVVTFWDVLEHVNEPREFLRQSAAMVRRGGRLMLSTPVRDTWFDRAGESAYRVTFGRARFLLQQRYSHTHLQIFHSQQLKSLLAEAGFRALYYRKVQELTMSLDRYFRNMYGETGRVKLLARCAAGLLRVAPLANKVLGLFEKQ
jgi:2-polyprenyl-3-methyl-5-hydroxy-6-metoxy-1,4-benzoquinol methylase